MPDGSVRPEPFTPQTAPAALDCQLVNERGGAGTINDGAFSSIDEDQLLIAGTDAQGEPFTPTITLHLAQRAKVQQIRIFGGANPFNAAPARWRRPR